MNVSQENSSALLLTMPCNVLPGAERMQLGEPSDVEQGIVHPCEHCTCNCIHTSRFKRSGTGHSSINIPSESTTPLHLYMCSILDKYTPQRLSTNLKHSTDAWDYSPLGWTSATLTKLKRAYKKEPTYLAPHSSLHNHSLLIAVCSSLKIYCYSPRL